LIHSSSNPIIKELKEDSVILELDKQGRLIGSYGDKQANRVRDLDLELGNKNDVCNSFFEEVIKTEKSGLDAYFSSDKKIDFVLSFVGKRGENYLFLKRYVSWNHPSTKNNLEDELLHILDENGNILFINDSTSHFFKFYTETSNTINLYELISPEFIPDFEKTLTELQSIDKPNSKIFGLKKIDGLKRFIEWSGRRIYVNGKHRILGKIRDLTPSQIVTPNSDSEFSDMKNVLNSGNVLFWSVNNKKQLISFNQAFADSFKNHFGALPEVETPLITFIKDHSKNLNYGLHGDKYDDVFKTQTTINYFERTEDLVGRLFYREIYLDPILKNGEVSEIVGIAVDVSEQKKRERKYIEETEKINTIFNSTRHMIWSINDQYELTFFNDYFKDQIERRFGEVISLGNKVLEISNRVKAREAELWLRNYDLALDGKQVRFEFKFKSKSDKEHTAEVSLNPIYNEEGKVIEVAGISQEITYKKAAEKKIKSQAAKIQAIFDSSVTLIWSVDTDFRIVSFNKEFADQHRRFLGKEVSIGSNALLLLEGHIKKELQEILFTLFTKAFNGEQQQFIGKLKGLEGEDVWLESFFNPIYDDDNSIKEVACMAYDVTAKRIIEQQMIDSLHEKEILLQEVHHRVKNNLQVISSILNLQSAYVKDNNTLAILRESQNRIKSMSFIHESLYQTKDLAGIEFTSYIHSLANNLIHSYSLEIGKIRLRTDLQDTFLSLDQAIPCGLIANELISNSLKYAFDKGETGEVYIAANTDGQLLNLTIADNGKGLPDNFDYEQSDSLGLQLVYTLVDQLDASIEVSNKGGTEYLITFEKQQ